ncbi:hypothetical protein MHB48_19780 [Psychrobacillus sp. FSL H8-0483]|uniref:DUF6904 family protein n=1 Tax=Psychrobacillus sp. FSL H8-0483 TaxID=2921389 RepID=UPI00315A63C0
MLALKNTENLTGALISGDFWDLDELCTTIYHLTRNQDRNLEWQGARIRLLSIAYDLRHAYQGERNVEFVANGLHKATMKAHDFIAPENNIYYSAEILWPELAFAFVAINDFIKLYKKEEEATDYDINVVNARKFQAIIAKGLKENMSKEEYTFFLSSVSSRNASVQEYAVQYIDTLNLSYIEMPREQRSNSFAAIIHNIIVDNNEYDSFKRKVLTEASKTKCSIHDLRLDIEYPEHIEW